MNREEYLSWNAEYRVTESLSLEVWDERVDIHLVRVNLSFIPHLEGILITPRFTYISESVMRLLTLKSEFNSTEKMFMDLIRNIKAEYTYKSDPGIVFDTNKLTMEWDLRTTKTLRNKRLVMESMTTDLNFYFYMFLSSDRLAKSMDVRMLPMMEEMDIYANMINKGFTLKYQSKSISDLGEMLDFCKVIQGVREDVSKFYSMMFIKGKGYFEHPQTDLNSEYKTVLDSILTGALTYQNFKFWERSRHNIFGQVVLRELGRRFNQKLDVDLPKVYDYVGTDCQKTPDWVDDEENMIIDFAVTTVNPGSIRDKKILKYKDLSINFSKHMNVRYGCDAIVWKISNRSEFQIPTQYRKVIPLLKSSEELDYLYETHLSIKMMDNYEKYRRMSELEKDMETEIDHSALNLLKSINKKKIELKKNYNCVKTTNIDLSRWGKRGVFKEKVELRDTRTWKEMEEMNNFNEREYENDLMNFLGKKMLNDDHPKSMIDIHSYKEKDVLKNVKEQMEKEKKNRIETENNLDFKIPKLFQFPVFKLDNENLLNSMGKDLTDPWGAIEMTDDGTLFYDSDFDYKEQKIKEQERTTKPYNVNGIGMDWKKDGDTLEELLSFMMADMDYQMDDSYSELNLDNSIKEIMGTNTWSMINNAFNLYFNLAYLEGRRHIFNSKSGHTVMRSCGSYVLMVKRGSRLTSQKQIRYKVMIPEENKMVNSEVLFHRFKESSYKKGFLETKWLTASITDIRHYTKVREVTLAMLSGHLDKMKEVHRGMNVIHNLNKREMMSQLMILLENKRGTSTSLQLNRYLVHGISSFVSNKNKLVEEITSSPIRSLGEAFVKLSQLNWFAHCIKDSESISIQKVNQMNSVSNDYDRFELPSFFNLQNKIEFTMMMDEMYLCNLFDKEAGFTQHRLKQIVNKQEEAEKNFQKVKKEDQSRGKNLDLEDFYYKKDELHKFDRRFVVSASRLFFKKKISEYQMEEAIMRSMSATIDSAMMMTASLVSGPYQSECLKFSTNLSKTKTFLSLFDEVNRLSTNLLSEMVDKFDKVDAIFAIFPKQQIGGPREILIQAVMLRIMVKFLETMSKNLCHMHEKEMMTKSSRRSEIQSDRMAEMRETVRIARKKGESALYYSVNSDASKWAPGFVMENFMYFIKEWPIPHQMKNLLLSVVSSFSSKKLMLPEDLKRKWEKKDRSEKEYSSNIESFRNESYENSYVVELSSGMGQGMFHYLSSIYHCIMDDYTDHIISQIMFRTLSTNINETSLVSSDDKTKMGVMIFKKGAYTAERSIKAYVTMMDFLTRLSNIHMNWKKSGLNFIITEFNSLFSVGKRMVWASIKDIYTSNSIPDLTSPEESIVFMLSNIRRCMEHGVYLTTINLMMNMARIQLMTYYRMNKRLIDNLKEMLNCSELDLPYNLGFMPTTMMVETLIYGPEVHMFKRENSEELKRFYRNLYRAGKTAKIKKNDEKDSDNTIKIVQPKKSIPFSEDSKGKYWFELPSRLDKQLIDIKKDFFESRLGMDSETVLETMNNGALNINLYKSDFKRYKQFVKEFFVGMNRKYEFQETMVVHSLIRALQLSKSKGVMYPKTKEMMRIEQSIMDKSDKMAMMMRSNRDIKLIYTEIEDLKEMKKSEMIDTLGFTLRILKIEDHGTTALDMYKGLQKVVDNYHTVKMELTKMQKSSKYYHTTMKTIRFYTSEIGSSVKFDDLVNHLFDPKNDMTNSLAEMIQDLKSMTDLKSDSEIYQNPFSFMKKIMKHSDMPYKDFKDYINLNYKSMKFVKINMIADFYCGGSMEENVLNVYRTRTNPSYIYERRDEMLYTNPSVLSFLTNTSLTRPLDYDTMYTMDEARIISRSDNKVTRAMKLKQVSDDNLVNAKLMVYRRFEYTKTKENNSLVEYWCNLSIMIKAIHFNNEIRVYIYSVKKMEENQQTRYIMSSFKYEMKKYEDEGRRITYMLRGYSDEKHEVMYGVSPMFFKTETNYRNSNWTISFTVEVFQNSRFGPGQKVTAKFKILTNNYTVDSSMLINTEILDLDNNPLKISTLMDEVPDVIKLDRLFIKNNWSYKFTLSESGSMTREDKINIDDITGFFGNVSVFSGISNVMGVIDKAEELEKDEKKDNNYIYDNLNVANLTSNMNENSLVSKLLMADENSGLNWEEEDVEVKNSDRESVIKLMDKLVNSAIRKEMKVDSGKMRDFWKVIKSSSTDNVVFHTLVISQIRMAFDYLISDNMMIMIYSIIMKNYMAFEGVSMINYFKKLSALKNQSIRKDQMFIEKRKDINQMSLSNLLSDFE